MGDDESFDLDDELGIGDDGDDFGDPLDNMLDDDDDAGGDAGDSGLDAFFEDLSNIDEMDGGEVPEPQATPAAAVAAPAAAAAIAAPAAAMAAAPEKKKGGMMKWLLILVILGGGGYGYWWYTNQEEVPMIVEPPPLVETDVPTNDGFLTVEGRKLPEPPKMVRQPPPARVERIQPRKVQPAAVVEHASKPAGKYLVQVATCSFTQCRDEYAAKLRNAGLPVYFKNTGDKYDFVEVLSKELFNLRDAQMWVQRINSKNERAGVASIQYKANGHRVSLGTYTSLERAKDMKIYLEGLVNAELRFNMEHVQKKYETIKIYAGPYASNAEAKGVLAGFKRSRAYPGAFIVRK